MTKGWKLQEIDATKVEQVHAQIFDVRRYCKLWPSIPEIELLGSCVAHPSGKYDDGTPWMWLLNTAAIPSPVTKHTACFVCRHCGQSFTRKTPAMPKFALANSLWIGRYPLAFKCGNKPLSVMTFLLLSLGRAVVQKIVAERRKPGPVREKQKGIRANTIAFPQAKLHELQTAHLPPKAEDATRFVSETISIALVGCDPEAGSVSLMHFAVFCINMSLYSTFIHLTDACQDLDHAEWAEIPRAAYMRAARFLVAHNVAYQHLSVNEEEARAQFAEVGGTCEAVRAQATPVEAEHQVPFKLSGPADTDMGGDSTFLVGEAEVAREENVENNYKPDEENPFEEVAEDLPGFRCAAGEVGSSDLDVERCFRSLLRS